MVSGVVVGGFLGGGDPGRTPRGDAGGDEGRRGGGPGGQGRPGDGGGAEGVLLHRLGEAVERAVGAVGHLADAGEQVNRQRAVVGDAGDLRGGEPEGAQEAGVVEDVGVPVNLGTLGGRIEGVAHGATRVTRPRVRIEPKTHTWRGWGARRGSFVHSNRAFGLAKRPLAVGKRSFVVGKRSFAVVQSPFYQPNGTFGVSKRSLEVSKRSFLVARSPLGQVKRPLAASRTPLRVVKRRSRAPKPLRLLD